MSDKTLFEEIIQTEDYQQMLENLPEDERKELVKSLKKLVDNWENNILKPLEKLSKG